MKVRVQTLNLFVLIFAVLSAAGCSWRVVYDTRSSYTVAPDAININTASAEQIESLPHIGRKTAEAIVAFREENGPFRRPENLLLIHGVSEARFADIRQFIRTE